MKLDELLAAGKNLAYRGAALVETSKRFQDADQEAAAEINLILSDTTSTGGKAYRLLGAKQHKLDAERLAEEKRQVLGLRMNLRLYEAERPSMDLSRDVADFVTEAQRPPSIEAAFIRYTNQVGVNADQILMLAMTEQLTIANLRAQVPTLSPSGRLALYRGALESPSEPVNSVTIRVIEETQGDYPDDGPLPEAELTAVATLGRLKQETRAARVPPEVADVQTVLDEVGRSITTAKRLGAMALNPAVEPQAAEKIQAELEAEEQLA